MSMNRQRWATELIGCTKVVEDCLNHIRVQLLPPVHRYPGIPIQEAREMLDKVNAAELKLASLMDDLEVYIDVH